MVLVFRGIKILVVVGKMFLCNGVIIFVEYVDYVAHAGLEILSILESKRVKYLSHSLIRLEPHSLGLYFLLCKYS